MRINSDIEATYVVTGLVQGVGFRPFVYRCAIELDLTGWVTNTGRGVEICVQGCEKVLSVFAERLVSTAPRLCRIDSFSLINSCQIAQPFTVFEILHSKADDGKSVLVTPDAAPCERCVLEMYDPANRRYGYPLISCTDCGPRYSIVQEVPYDRHLTSLRNFDLCTDCAEEYMDPLDDRYHAQTISCWFCGPQVSFRSRDSGCISGTSAIVEARRSLKRGDILAVKGIGGYHLVVDALNDAAVARLRARKKRPNKPFAVMAFDEAQLARFVKISPAASALLRSIERPIVLLEIADEPAAKSVAPGLKQLGGMLPSSPLHMLLFDEDLSLLVATSGNVSGLPMICNDKEAIRELSIIADGFVSHDREIQSPIDDSVMSVSSPLGIDQVAIPIRRARGLVPLPLKAPWCGSQILALGADLKNTIAFLRNREVFVSEYIGDLLSQQTTQRQHDIIARYERLFGFKPNKVVSDMHPGMSSSRIANLFANQTGVGQVKVQHHHAHMAACMLENGIAENENVIGVVFDGFGYGCDGHAWGGEFFVGGIRSVIRAAHFAPLSIPGINKSATDPDRVAVSMLQKIYGCKTSFPSLPLSHMRSAEEISVFARMVENGVNCTTSAAVGRIFDGVSSLLGICHSNTYEGEAAIKLEAAIEGESGEGDVLPYEILEYLNHLEIDLLPGIGRLIGDFSSGNASAGTLSRKFHTTIVAVIVKVVCLLQRKYSADQVVLSGGVFVNKFLLHHAIDALSRLGFTVHSHSILPPGDGCISAGQALIASAIQSEMPIYSFEFLGAEPVSRQLMVS